MYPPVLFLSGLGPAIFTPKVREMGLACKLFLLVCKHFALSSYTIHCKSLEMLFVCSWSRRRSMEKVRMGNKQDCVSSSIKMR
jgi:hypothetical protein